MAPVAELRDVEAELLRLRDRVHKTEKDCAALELYRQAIIRDVDDLDARVGRVEHQVTELAQADEIAAAVQQRLSAHRSELFTVWQRLGAALVLLCTMATTTIAIQQALT